MLALQTRNGIQLFKDREEYDTWMSTGMNRFQVLSELEEIEETVPVVAVKGVYAVIVDGDVRFFDSEEEAEEKAEEMETRVYFHEVKI